eukprot:5967322-Amphidinium_carterae.1
MEAKTPEQRRRSPSPADRSIKGHLETLHLGATTDGGVHQARGIGGRTKAAAPTAREDRQDARLRDPLCDHLGESNHHREAQRALTTDHLDLTDRSRLGTLKLSDRESVTTGCRRSVRRVIHASSNTKNLT